MPPLKLWQIMPVPPPTAPSSTAVSLAASIAAKTCSGRTCIPSMSFSRPSYVSPTTGRCHAPAPRSCWYVTSASRTTPTENVFVSATGVVSSPDSRTHSSPVSSPFPFRRCAPAKSGRLPGSTTVTPVRTSSPSISVACPTRVPPTSVIASSGPGSRSPRTMPRSRGRRTTSRRSSALEWSTHAADLAYREHRHREPRERERERPRRRVRRDQRHEERQREEEGEERPGRDGHCDACGAEPAAADVLDDQPAQLEAQLQRRPRLERALRARR